MAIEVEKKFILDEEAKINLVKDAEFLGIKVFTDTYYDTDKFGLSLKDTWLRFRENRWELKISLDKLNTKNFDQYMELESESEIREYLKLGNEVPFMDALVNAFYKPIAKYTTTRKKYKKEGFIIDIDSADFGYEIVEIEKMVDMESNIEQASRDIMNFAEKHNLKGGQVRGKLTEYLRRNKKEYFDILVKAGIIFS